MHKSTGRAFAAVSITAAAFVALGAGSASAGEVTGNGTPKPVNGKSACAFSGQNDGWHGVDPHGAEPDPLRVQNWGREHKFLVAVVGLPKGFPGIACNPSGTRG